MRLSTGSPAPRATAKDAGNNTSPATASGPATATSTNTPPNSRSIAPPPSSRPTNRNGSPASSARDQPSSLRPHKSGTTQFRDLAAQRLRHEITEPTIPTGPDTPDPVGTALWTSISPTVAQARVWLDTHTTMPATPATRARSVRELHARRDELDVIFADVPADHRALIEQLRQGATLPLEDTTLLLQEALDQHGERRQWILEHWPHVVEYAQITHTLDHGLAGPDPTPLIAALATSTHPHLAAAATASETWLVTLAAQITVPDSDSIDPATEALLADVADYRARWSVTSPSPLGDGALDLDQADHRTLLTLAINHAHDRAVDPNSPGIEDPWTDTLFDRLDDTAPAFDDSASTPPR